MSAADSEKQQNCSDNNKVKLYFHTRLDYIKKRTTAEMTWGKTGSTQATGSEEPS